jgi:DNA-binding HxlR family transcriptional regulator
MPDCELATRINEVCLGGIMQRRVQEVALGKRRFDQILGGLGIASNVLTDRLNRLVDEGILERVALQ